MPLAAVGLATAVAYGVWVVWVPLLPGNVYVPLLDLGKITGYTWSSTAMYVGLMAALYVLYAAGYWLARRGRASSLLIFAFGTLFCAEMLGVYPATAVDVFGYMAHGRLLALHGANPFIFSPNAYPGDPIVPYLAFPNEPSQYGPAWVLIGAGLASIATRLPDALLTELLLYKVVAALAHIASAALVLGIARRLGADAVRARVCCLLFLWNPLLLWEMVGNAHNDGVMMLGGLVAAFLLLAGQWVLVLPALALGVLVKLPLAIVAPLFFIATWRRKKLLAIEGAALALVLAAVVYRPFWEGLETLTALRRTELFTASLASVLRLSFEPRVGLEMSSAIARSVSLGAFGLIVGACLVLAVVARDLRRILSLSYATLLATVLLATTWFQAWYVVWPLAFGAALPDGRRHLEVALLSLGGWLQYGVFIYLWVMMVLPPDNLLVIQTTAFLGVVGPLVVGSALAFATRARYAH